MYVSLCDSVLVYTFVCWISMAVTNSKQRTYMATACAHSQAFVDHYVLVLFLLYFCISLCIFIPVHVFVYFLLSYSTYLCLSPSIPHQPRLQPAETAASSLSWGTPNSSLYLGTHSTCPLFFIKFIPFFENPLNLSLFLGTHSTSPIFENPFNSSFF